MIAAFISIMLLIVARHHPPSRRKIKQIWHGRVYWESNTTMLRRPALNVSEAPQNVLSNNIKEPIASISKNDLSISKNDASISKNDDSTSKSDDSTSKNDDSTSKSDASLSNDKDSVQVHNYESIHALLHSVNPNACTKHKILKGDNSKEPDVHVCMDNISPPCVVYSFGIANIWIFDDFMISQGCHVFSFDPSMNVGKHKRHENHLFEPIGIGSKSGRHGGPTTLINGQTNYDVLTLGDIMKRYNHERVTLVRMDTEYAEWDVLQQWENDNMFSKIDQLLLEIHMWPKSSHRNHGQLHSEILHSIPMTLFHEAQNKWDRTRLAGDMTRVYEVGFITESQPTTEPKKIDIFHVNHEKAMWRMRFEEHWDFVDEFHIFESSVSHQGKPKRLYFKESRNEFKQYASKIVYHEINSDYNSDACKKTGNWKCETHDRIEIAKAMNGILRDDDIVIFSDVDEFVFEDVLAKLEKQPSLLPTRIRTPVYKYSLHWKQQKSDKWKSCIVARAAYVKKYNDWNNLRRKNDITATIEHGGLHLSTFGSIDEIVTKSLHSRTKRILDRGDVVKRVNNGISLWDINKHFVYEENVPILPKLAKSDPGYFEEHFMRYGKAKKKPVVRPEQNEAEEAPSKTFFFEKMVDAVEEYSKYSPVLWDMDCWPHYPTYGGSETNFISGTRATCRKINEKKFCSYLDTLDDEKTYVWINQHSNSDRKTLPWDKCRRTNVFYTYISFGDTRPPNDIPIPTHTTPNEKYPASELENTKRCEDASLHVSFVGQMKTPVRQKISNQFSSYPLAKIESNPKGWKNSRMFDLLYTSKFGLVPRGDAMFSYRLMETMAMGVVPIIISDGWQLPFEDMLDWSEFSIRVREDDISTLPSVIEAYRDKACEMSAKVYDVYHKYMATPKAIVEAIDKQIGMYTRPASTQTTAKISIVSWLASEWSNKGYEAMLKNRKAYARKHGYTFLDFDETNLPTPELRLNYQQLSHYIKQPLILAVMEDCKPEDWVIWMDADTMFTNDQKKWEQYLSGDMVFAEAPDVIANNGIFALRCNDWGRFFIRLWSEECKTMKTGGRLQNPEAKAGDNAPFVHALLRAFAHTHNVNYDNNCRQENGWGALVRCYNRQIEAIVQESGLSRTRGPNEELGSGLVSDPHITGVWGINSGLGFKPPNDWHEGDFILHLAGKGKKDRDTLGLKYSATVKEGVTSTLETPQMSNTVRECALLFFGLAKHFNDIVYPSIQKYILNTNPDCDVYAHTYDIKEITNPRNKEDRTPVNPLEVYSMTNNVVIDTLESVSKAIDFDYYHEHYKRPPNVNAKLSNYISMDNSLKQWFSIQRVWESMPTTYKRVGLFRLDVLYTEPIDIQNGDAVIPNFQHSGGLNDRAFYGLYKWAGQWATNRFKKLAIRSQKENSYSTHAETFMKYLMRDVPVELKPMCFQRVRATGEIMTWDCTPGVESIDKQIGLYGQKMPLDTQTMRYGKAKKADEDTRAPKDINNAEVHVAFSTDKWSEGFNGALRTLDFYVSKPVRVHIVVPTVDTRIQIQKKLDESFMKNMKFSYYILPVVSVPLRPLQSRLTQKITWGTLLLNKMLSPNIKRVLCLDIDILIHTDIVPLFETKMANIIAGVFQDEQRVRSWAKMSEFPENQKMLNSGVILMDLDAWRNNNMDDFVTHSMETLKHNNDQTIFNFICAKYGCGKLEKRWNIYNLGCGGERKSDSLIRGIYHWSCHRKWWKKDGNNIKIALTILKEIDKKKPRKCALLFFGLAKHFNDIVYPSIQKYILNTNPDCDVYAHTYDIKEITNPRNKEDHTPVNPLEVYSMTDNVILDTLESVSKAIDFDYYHKHYKQKGGVFPYSMDNSLKQWFSIQRVWESMPSKYKRVGLFRLDVLYTEPVNIQNGDAVIPDFHHWGGLNDRGFYGLYKWAGQWATNRLKKLAIRSKQDNIYDMNAEHFMKYMMRDVPVELKPMCFNRVRATGKIKNDCKPTLVATKPSITPVSANSIQKSYTSNVRLENGVIVKTLKGNLKGYNMIQREKCVLDRLKKFKWAPKVLSSTDNIMKMTYMGEKVNKENIPLDYADQMNQILTDMESVDVQHNDMIYPCAVKSFRKHEVMVLNGRLSIVDFGWATINDSVPCGVSTKKFVPNWNPCPDKTILQVLKNYKKDNFVSYRNKKRKVGSQSETPSFKVLGNANIRIGGYQRFDINLKTKLVSNIRSYKDKFNWVKQTLINLRLSGMQGFMDIGCNNGLSSFLAQEVGYDNVISLDHDSEAIHVLKQVVDLQSTSVIHPREFSFGNPFNNKVDVVLCGALIHWVFTCTADFGKFDLILQYLLNTGLKILLLEWVDPKDPAIKKFHHLNCGTKPKETYSVSNFEKSVLKVGNIREKWPLPRRPTRVMYQIEIYHN